MVKDSKTVHIFSTKIVCFTFQVFDSQSIIFANLFSPKESRSAGGGTVRIGHQEIETL